MPMRFVFSDSQRMTPSGKSPSEPSPSKFSFVSGPPIPFFLRKAGMRPFCESQECVAPFDALRRTMILPGVGAGNLPGGAGKRAGLLGRRGTNGEQEAQDD